MKKISQILFFFCLMAVSLPAFCFLERKVVALGKSVPGFELEDTAGKTVHLSDYQGKIVMIHFWSATCPFVLRYEERIQQMVKDYANQGVVVLGIASNVNETKDQILKVTKERNINYPILLDPKQKIADQFGAITTPHLFIINKEGALAYEGSVDDQGWSEKNSVTQSYAREAIEALLSNIPVPNPKTDTFGCTVKRAS